MIVPVARFTLRHDLVAGVKADFVAAVGERGCRRSPRLCPPGPRALRRWPGLRCRYSPIAHSPPRWGDHAGGEIDLADAIIPGVGQKQVPVGVEAQAQGTVDCGEGARPPSPP